MITFYINGTEFQIEEKTLGYAIAAAIPDFVRSENVPAPNDLADIIRTALVGASPLFMNELLFYIYGANAPKLQPRADKLPVLCVAFIDMVLGALKRYRVDVNAEEIDALKGIFRIKSYIAKPLSEAALREMARSAGCRNCPDAAPGTDDRSSDDTTGTTASDAGSEAPERAR